ncbi:MAG: OmpA family protein [Paludibacteraceae bacterium]|nr:OmpA family protein [Paludibacteraceae bacterium]
MRKTISAILLSAPCLMANALESLECNFIDKFVNVDGFEAVSHLNDTTIIIKRSDSLFIAKTDNLGKVYDYVYDKNLTSLNAEGQIAYDGKESYYYTNKGKMYVTKIKDGKIVSTAAAEIPGTVMGREKYEHSALVYASWHYKPEDTIRVSNPTLSKNGKQIFFSANLKGSKGRDIYSSNINNNGTFSQPRKLGKSVNSDGDEDFPYIRKDGQITFCSNRKNSSALTDKGKYNVYISKTNTTDAPELMKSFVERNTPEIVKVEVDTTPLIAVVPDTIKPAVSDTLVAIAEPEKKVEPAKPVEKNDDEYVDEPTENGRILQALAYDSDSTGYPVSAQALSDIFQDDQDAMVMASKHVVAGIDKRIFYFDYDTDVLNNKDYENDIKCIVDFINFYPGNSFLIIGHTDERGTREYNNALSLRRAKKIESILAQRGISRSRMFVMGFGEDRPVIRHAQTEDQHQKNRRVEILKME